MDETPFHPGELKAQERAGLFARGAGIREFMPAQHRDFFTLLPYLFAAGLDRDGWPIGTALTGVPGFAHSPSPISLRIDALPAAGDPASTALQQGAGIGLLGIDLTTRRRNRANGIVARRDAAGLSITVTQSFGNCAKYIQTRSPTPIVRAPAQVEQLPGLDQAARLLIGNADTLFVASASGAGVDISHRGGRPGFVRIDGDVLTIPDFAGNSYFNTLGNLLIEPRAALLFIDFERGDLVQLQGETEIVWEGPELGGLDRAERLWRFRVRRAWRHGAALPFAWSAVEPAPTTLETGTWRRERPAA
ncbi:pyridoxamine 5'-phosphate oxidase family protein [Bosea sp. (in: a-proteobacteria)]|jgi:predicted pyridoxine 5'-phosphate oxidase superfamily flavin-nucleotide-binding protein|uniref:pyridoxamine 5'-phosphate oxidase family protein n=1 Tax=Bosea sp. (in: a-proteobacteria) TaxID=1871050 RepID=UPI003F6F14E8